MDKLDPEVHAVRFVPRGNGVHYFHVKCNGVHIPGSPMRLRVGEEEADPAACSASGPGLKEAVVGVKTDFMEAADGYKVRYTPLVNGDYYVHIKYNGVHIS